jgi:hypothetical protein
MRQNRLAIRAIRLGGILIAILLCCFFSVITVWFVRTVLAMRYPIELNSPAAPLMTIEEIRTLETFVGFEFPASTKVIYAYHDSHDVSHLYVKAEFPEDDGPRFLAGLPWQRVASVSADEVESLLMPITRTFGGVIASSEPLSWWHPNKDRIKWLYEEGNIESTEIVAVIEKLDNVLCVYVHKATYGSSLPAEIASLFPRTPNWDVRQSTIYPKQESPGGE